MIYQSRYRSIWLIIPLIIITAGTINLGGCGVTQQTNLWADPSYHGTPMKNILVIAMNEDQLRRRMWEDAIVTAFSDKKHAVTVAVASYQLFPDNLPDTLTARLKTKEEGFDGVLLVAKIRLDTLTNDVPGYTTNEEVTTYSRRWGAYVTHYENIYHPGYAGIETFVSVRTDLLVPQEDGRLVWSVTSQSLDPTSAGQFRSSVADRVVDRLKKGRFTY